MDLGWGRVAREPAELCPDGEQLRGHDGAAVRGHDQPLEHHGPATELGQPSPGTGTCKDATFRLLNVGKISKNKLLQWFLKLQCCGIAVELVIQICIRKFK